MKVKFRKKPLEIEAIKYTGQLSYDEMLTAWGADFAKDSYHDAFGLRVLTREGVMYPSVGDYIIRGIAGEYYSCQAEIFEKSYEPVEA